MSKNPKGLRRPAPTIASAHGGAGGQLFPPTHQAMELEPAPLPEQHRLVAAKSAIFPINCSWICPPVIRLWIPSTFFKVQDMTHFLLVVGVVSMATLVAKFISMIMRRECQGYYCLTQIMGFLFMLGTAKYFVRLIHQYDDTLQTKQREAQIKKNSLTKSYNDLLSSMDTLLTTAAESSAGLAERSFESKRRDFQRFLQRAKTRYSCLYSSSGEESERLLKQFRRFCVNWLVVFEECSIDPINNPKRVVSVDELNRCATVVEVCDLCLERLRITETRFISMQRDHDAQMLNWNRNKIKDTGGSQSRAEGDSGVRIVREKVMQHKELAVRRRCRFAPRCGWMSFGVCMGCGGGGSQDDGGYPFHLRLICCQLSLLSEEHVGMLLCVFFFTGLIFTQLYALQIDKTYEFGMFFLFVLIEVTVSFTLMRFEDIDVIHQLEREVQRLARNTALIEKQRQEMRDFWVEAQQLTELWLYRTVPRLDLCKELHSQLEDAPSEILLTHMATSNVLLEELTERLGALEHWRGGGELTLDVKKKFGKDIHQICQEQDFDTILTQLELITRTCDNSLFNVVPPQQATSFNSSTGRPKTQAQITQARSARSPTRMEKGRPARGAVQP